MEVTTPHASDSPKPLMRDYWSKFRKRTYIVITSMQCAFMLVLFGSFELFGITHLSWLLSFIVAFAAAAAINAITITLIHILGKPFRDLVQTVVLISGEPLATAPPNPNTTAYAKDGFKDILQAVYELASARDDRTSEPAKPQPNADDVVLEGLDHTPNGIAIFDQNRKIVYSNKHAPIRVSADGDSNLNLIFPDDDQLDTWIANCQKNKLSAEHRWTRVASSLPGEKDRRLFDVVANYQKDSSAETIVTLFDRTHDYTPEEDDLDFISFAAHELRGPITVIRGYLDVLNDELGDSLEQDQTELLQRLTVAANRLTSYVNNILNASRYDRRHFKLHLGEEGVRHMYDLISDDMQMRASAQNRLLVADIPDNLPTVAADPNAIGEVFGNLIDNAIKYSNEGGLVHVVARTIPGFVEISVIDRGIGMPSSVLPNLFHKFYRSHRSRETVSGTGIGLYICKAIVSSHGGVITARSIENEGSTFTFTLPIYDTVADKLQKGDMANSPLIEHGSGWIKNHAMYRG